MTRKRIWDAVVLATLTAAACRPAAPTRPPRGDAPDRLAPREDGLFSRKPVDRPRSKALPDDAAERLAALGYLTGYEKPTAQAGVRIHAELSAPHDYNLYTSGHAPVAVLMDMHGKILHEWKFDPRQEATLRPLRTKKMRRGTKYMRRAWLYPNGDLLALFDWGGVVKVDKASRKIWFNNGSFHHDIDVQKDGTIYTLSEARAEDEALGPGRLDNAIVVLDARGQVRKSVSLWTAFRNTFPLVRIKELLNLELTDIFHANSVDVLEVDATTRHPALKKGRALVSMRTPSLMALVDLDAQRIELVLEGAWARQHEARFLENGNILFFDNEGQGGASRVLELAAPDWSLAWSYGADPPSAFFSRQQGTVRRLANGNTLVTESMRGRAFELNPQKEIVWEFVSPHRAAEDEGLVAVLLDVRRIDGRFPVDWRGVKRPL